MVILYLASWYTVIQHELPMKLSLISSKRLRVDVADA